MFKKIVVPLDGSTNAEITIPYVESIGIHLSTEISLVSVADRRISEVDQLHHAYLDHMTEQMQQLFNDSDKGAASSVRNEVLEGKAFEEIVRYTDKIDADMIAMASRGFSGQKLPLLGNVSVKVLWATKKPVLLIRAPVNDNAIGEPKLIKKILTPLDGSKAGEASIAYAESLALAMDAELILFQAIEPVKFIAGYDSLAPLAIPRSEDIKDAAISYLKSQAKRLKNKNARVSIEVIWGSAAEAIIDYTETHAIDLIAISAHGRSNVSRWVFGSVTEKLLHAGQTALLIVH
jgi:nucleotide-binding universal stress UspA family protein